jgi:type I restriction enzyme R subunit
VLAQRAAATVVDRTSLDAGQFKTDGGFARLNKVFDGQLETLLGELADEVWKDAG